MFGASNLFLHPAAGFFALALVLPFLSGRWWRWLLPLPAVYAVFAIMGMSPGVYGHMEWMGFPLVLGRVDRLSLVFAHVFAIQALIGFIYAFHLKEKRQHIAAAFYVGGSFGCVFAGDYLTLFLFWEIMSVASALLIWFNYRDNPHATAAGFRYFLFHTLGGLLLLGGLLVRAYATGDWAFEFINPATAQWYDWLILLGFGVNAAFIGLHAWLPDAYPEATVTGAVFMSAYTTKTAVYTLARAFVGWDFLAVMGVLMTLYGVVYATMENNARRILSYHIVSQVGYMVAGIGLGSALTMNGATAHAYAHILYKGLLFMSVGTILFATGTAKLDELGGLVRKLPLVMVAYIVAGLSISGWPLFNGFISKTMTIAGAFEVHRPLLGLGMELAAVGTFLSVGIKLPYFAFFGGKQFDPQRRVKPVPVNMYIAMGLGSALCIAQGIYPDLLYRFLPMLPVEYTPWTRWHVLQALVLLSFAGLVFYLFRQTMKPHAQRNLDFEYLYVLAGRIFLFVCKYPVAFLDSLWSQVYRVVGLRALLQGGRITSWFDREGIDGVVDGTASKVRRTGAGAAQVQTGRLQDYLAGVILTGAVILFIVLLLN